MITRAALKNAAQRGFQTSRKLAMTFEGNVNESLGTEEERMTNVFGGRVKGDPPRSSSRIVRGDARYISGISVPEKPSEPDNCCMSGCVNCVWEIYNDDLREWKDKRKQAAHKLKGTDEIWPPDFDPPLNSLDLHNIPVTFKTLKIQLDKQKSRGTAALFPPRESRLPQSVIRAKRRHQSEKAAVSETQKAQPDNDEGWDDVPVFIRVFAEFEAKKKQARMADKDKTSEL
ncbi:LANO_0E07712g1_1 [Lachancea nothofagi CBS 11611]|uniref:LANO_0E07712g1_1 n=1 Tax=Lachancea nothofagi CBS 11611 TaxID=1266666 RepID=A0A1G4JUP3_9SACH|nr:LANO_0E07712g1_1 [Lachancea nothofagi CBS 11611]